MPTTIVPSAPIMSFKGRHYIDSLSIDLTLWIYASISEFSKILNPAHVKGTKILDETLGPTE